jgi:hypothetical protein
MPGPPLSGMGLLFNFFDVFNKEVNSLARAVRIPCFNCPDENCEHKAHSLREFVKRPFGLTF